MKGKSIIIAGSIALSLLLSGCMVSSQEGERSHVNSPAPDQITYHFDSTYNKLVLVGRSAVVAILGFWVAGLPKRESRALAMGLIAVPACAVAAWIVLDGLVTIDEYRIDVTLSALHVTVPPEEEHVFTWEEIEGLYVEGTEYVLGTGIDKYADYETMELYLAGDERFLVDLSRLSVEQRGSLWRVVVKRAKLVEG